LQPRRRAVAAQEPVARDRSFVAGAHAVVPRDGAHVDDCFLERIGRAERQAERQISGLVAGPQNMALPRSAIAGGQVGFLGHVDGLDQAQDRVALVDAERFSRWWIGGRDRLDGQGGQQRQTNQSAGGTAAHWETSASQKSLVLQTSYFRLA
jgi:hypothetical protein